MKDFLRYSKNRFLYSFFKLLILLAIGFLIGSLKAKASTITDYQFQMRYFTYSITDKSDVSSESGWTAYHNPNEGYSLTLYGTDDYSPTYDKFQYMSGFDTKINYSISKGVSYTATLVFNFTSISDSEFSSSRLNYFTNSNLVRVSNSAYSYGSASYSKNDCFTYSSVKYCTYTATINYSFTAISDASSFALGSWNNNGSGFAFFQHNQTSDFSLTSLSIEKNADNTIINQNETIINQNQGIIDNQNKTNEKLDEAENTRKGIWETIKSIPGTIGTFFDNLGTKIGNFFKDLLDGIIDGLKTLFIPEDGYFETWFNNFKNYFEVKLGFLATPFTIFIDFVNSYLELDSSNDIIIDIPDITVPNFEENKIVSATSFNWSQTLKSKESLNTLWQLYLSFVDVYLILNFINLCENKYNRIFGGDTSNYEYYTVEDSYTFDNDTGEVLSSRRNERTTTRKKVDK